MKYNRIVTANFIDRPNRFVAYVNLLGECTKVHVKNTGRCRELLTPDATVYLEESDNTSRSTKYDLVAVEKAGRLINMDSAAPNCVVGEWLKEGGLFSDVSLVKPETTFGNSRFDFYIETDTGRKAFIEVKGVTLEENNVASFPDAPSERALKHVEELIYAKSQGYEAFLVFVVQMKGIVHVEPNRRTQQSFADALVKARRAGVHILAYDCEVTSDSLKIDKQLPVVIDELDRIAKPLLAWYDKGRRILPWREEPTPYHVWISEIMLQQTRVEAVKPYYDRFMEEIPDIRSLARVDEEKLLKLWEGLGYYNRARNLKKAAMQIVNEYDGKMPMDYEELLKLPGIGSYTAGAISSIAYNRKQPAVDGNVLRVLSRLRMDDGDVLDAKVKKLTEEDLRTVMPIDRPGDFNQALMELGAMVCIPNGEARCELCPWSDFCRAKAKQVVALYPKKKAKKARAIEKKTVLLLQDANRIALQKRPERGLLAGMYEFPMLEGHVNRKELISYLHGMGVQPIKITKLEPVKHIFSHKEWHMIGYAIRVDELFAPDKDAKDSNSPEFIYADPMEAGDRYPIPSAFAKYAGYVEIKQGIQKDEELK